MEDVVRLTLCRVVAEYGREVYEDFRRCENLLRDLCAAHRREVSVLVRALPERVAVELADSRSNRTPRDVMIPKLSRRLERNLALTPEAARWAVESWAAALLDAAPAGPSAPWYEFEDETGSAQKAVALAAGLAVFEAHHFGAGNFLVELYDGAGRYVELLANEIGDGHAVKPVHIPAAGDYTLDVRARGRWTLEVRQPAPFPGAARELPFTFDSAGQDATPFFLLEAGTAEFEAEHEGQSNFVVTLLSGEGRYVELLANEIGGCRTQASVPVADAGHYLLDVAGDGRWRVSVR